ncbi:MAG: D-alanine--D-alanine ligase [Patescibacteria group bacterium]|nr:D-alanine--D-alanine ligase [Patescibacteria group bacterium]
MTKKRVGVIRGGPSAEYEVSLGTGTNVLSALHFRHEDKYVPVDILIDKSGIWHVDGAPVEPDNALRRVDIIVNALHGTYGEDGKVQRLLEAHGMPFTGSGSLASAVAMNKILTKEVAKKHGIKSPYWKEVSSDRVKTDPEAAANEVFTTFLLPAVIKPAASGSSVGVSIVKDRAGIADALIAAAGHGHAIMIEEFISGIEATCGVVESFRGQQLYALPPIEIRPKTAFFDYKAKYTPGMSDEIVPARFADEIKREIESLAAKVHEVLGLRHYSRSDFIIHPRRGIYFLEVNTLPGLTDGSLIPKALRAVGSDTHELVDHLIRLALQ